MSRLGVAVEAWRVVRDYPRYDVSSLGRVRSRVGRKPRILKQDVGRNGYHSVRICGGGRPKKMLVHRLALLVFIGPCPSGMETRHLNGVRSDNRLANLRWGNKAEQWNDKVLHDTAAIGERNPEAKLTDADALLVRQLASDDIPLKRIAARFGVDKAAIRRCVYGKTWGHVERIAGVRLPVPGARQGGRHGMAKLTASEVVEIRQLHAGGERTVSLARRFGVGHSSISNIVHRKSWRHLPKSKVA